MTDLIDTIIPEKIPRHIAIIMDGNGRWANEKGQERLFGHSSGVKSVREAIKTAIELGVSYITLYAFSIENWNRPKQEVDGLMDLLISSIANEIDEFNENGVKLLTIGDINSLPENCMLSIKDAVSRTSENSKLTLILAVNYSSKWEITQAVRTITESVNNNELAITEITENLIQRHLSTNSIPDPELLIRTSGEYRISNFLLWQIAYTELYFTEILWPDFRRNDFIQAVIEYQNRERRFGLLSTQIDSKI
jgi:undecaprenyl diphosphate synthase